MKIHPLQKECDINNPKQFAAWCWAAGIPDPSPSRPMPIPLITPQLVESVSEMLWNFGFRHHPELQTRWIDGMAGIATMARMVDQEPEEDPFEKMAEEFLGENNPKLLELIRKTPVEERDRLLRQLERNFDNLQGLIEALRSEV